jgi:ABC-type transporter Mla subunit MlaD
VTYFDQPVGALDTGSAVKYMGLEVGGVQAIDVSPNADLMAVVLKVRRPELVTERTVARIESVGFTGVGFIQLVHTPPGDEIRNLELDFDPPHPVIPSEPSTMDSLMATARRMADRLESLDLKGTVGAIRGAADSARDLLGSSEVERTLSNLESASRRIARTTRHLQELAASDSLQAVPAELEATLAETHRLVGQIEEKLEALDLAGTSARVNGLLATADEQGRVLSLEVEGLIHDLRRTSDTLDRLLLRLKNNPSELLFGKPAPASKRE